MDTIKTARLNLGIFSALLLIFLTFPVKLYAQENTFEIDLTELEELIENGAYKEALADSKNLLEQYPTTPQVQFIHATILEKVGQKSHAIEIYNDLISHYPGYPEPYNNLALSYANEGNYDSALSILEDALFTNPSYATIYLNIKSIYDKLASDAYRVALNSNTPSVKLSLASLDKIPMDTGFGDNDIIVVAQAPQTETVTEIETAKNPSPEMSIATSAEPSINTEPSEEPLNIIISEEDSDSEVENKGLLQETENKIQKRIESWAATWAAQDYDGYLSYYSGEFQPTDNLSLAEWKEQRRGRLLWREFIIVKLTDMKIEVEGNLAKAKFRQYYKSNIYEGTGTKTLKLIQHNGQWFITHELI